MPLQFAWVGKITVANVAHMISDTPLILETGCALHYSFVSKKISHARAYQISMRAHAAVIIFGGNIIMSTSSSSPKSGMSVDQWKGRIRINDSWRHLKLNSKNRIADVVQWLQKTGIDMSNKSIASDDGHVVSNNG